MYDYNVCAVSYILKMHTMSLLNNITRGLSVGDGALFNGVQSEWSKQDDRFPAAHEIIIIIITLIWRVIHKF